MDWTLGHIALGIIGTAAIIFLVWLVTRFYEINKGIKEYDKKLRHDDEDIQYL